MEGEALKPSSSEGQSYILTRSEIPFDLTTRSPTSFTAARLSKLKASLPASRAKPPSSAQKVGTIRSPPKQSATRVPTESNSPPALIKPQEGSIPFGSGRGNQHGAAPPAPQHNLSVREPTQKHLNRNGALPVLQGLLSEAQAVRECEGPNERGASLPLREAPHAGRGSMPSFARGASLALPLPELGDIFAQKEEALQGTGETAPDGEETPESASESADRAQPLTSVRNSRSGAVLARALSHSMVQAPVGGHNCGTADTMVLARAPAGTASGAPNRINEPDPGSWCGVEVGQQQQDATSQGPVSEASVPQPRSEGLLHAGHPAWVRVPEGAADAPVQAEQRRVNQAPIGQENGRHVPHAAEATPDVAGKMLSAGVADGLMLEGSGIAGDEQGREAAIGVVGVTESSSDRGREEQSPVLASQESVQPPWALKSPFGNVTVQLKTPEVFHAEESTEDASAGSPKPTSAEGVQMVGRPTTGERGKAHKDKTSAGQTDNTGPGVKSPRSESTGGGAGVLPKQRSSSSSVKLKKERSGAPRGVKLAVPDAHNASEGNVTKSEASVDFDTLQQHSRGLEVGYAAAAAEGVAWGNNREEPATSRLPRPPAEERQQLGPQTVAAMQQYVFPSTQVHAVHAGGAQAEADCRALQSEGEQMQEAHARAHELMLPMPTTTPFGNHTGMHRLSSSVNHQPLVLQSIATHPGMLNRHVGVLQDGSQDGDSVDSRSLNRRHSAGARGSLLRRSFEGLESSRLALNRQHSKSLGSHGGHVIDESADPRQQFLDVHSDLEVWQRRALEAEAHASACTQAQHSAEVEMEGLQRQVMGLQAEAELERHAAAVARFEADAVSIAGSGRASSHALDTWFRSKSCEGDMRRNSLSGDMFRPADIAAGLNDHAMHWQARAEAATKEAHVLRHQAQEWQARVEAANFEVENLHRQVRDWQARAEGGAGEIELLRRQVMEWQARTEEAVREADVAKCHAMEWQQSGDNAHAEVTGLRQAYGEAAAQLDSMSNSLERFKATNNALLDEKAALQQQVREVHQQVCKSCQMLVQAQFEEARHSQARLDRAQRAIENERASAARQLACLQAELGNARHEAATAAAALAAHIERAAQTPMGALEAELSCIRGEMAQLEAEVKAWKARGSWLEDSLQAAHSEMAEKENMWEVEQRAMRGRIQDLEAAVQQSQEAHMAIQADFQQALDNNAVLISQLYGGQQHGNLPASPPVVETAAHAEPAELVEQEAEPHSGPHPQGGAGSDVSEVLARLRAANEELADALSAKERHLLDARAAEEKAASMEGVALDLSVQCTALAVTVDKLVGENEEMVACLNGQSRLLESVVLPRVEGNGNARAITEGKASPAQTLHSPAWAPDQPAEAGMNSPRDAEPAPERKKRLSFWQYIAGEDRVA